MIPKIIHYFWFGGQPLSELAKNVLKAGKNIVPIMKSNCGTRTTIILHRINICIRLIYPVNTDLR